MPALARHRVEHREFDPRSIPGLVLWLRPETLGGVAGAQITDWLDESGQRNHAYKTTAAHRPLVELTRAPTRARGMSAGFDGTDDNMDLPNITVTSGSVLFAGQRTDGTNYRGVLIAHAIGVYQAVAGTRWGGYISADLDSNQNMSQYGSAPPSVQAMVVQSGNTDVDLYTNGGSKVTRTRGAFNARGATRLGADPTGVQFFYGGLFELLVWDRTLGHWERRPVEEYLYRRHTQPPSFPLNAWTT